MKSRTLLLPKSGTFWSSRKYGLLELCQLGKDSQEFRVKSSVKNKKNRFYFRSGFKFSHNLLATNFMLFSSEKFKQLKKNSSFFLKKM